MRVQGYLQAHCLPEDPRDSEDHRNGEQTGPRQQRPEEERGSESRYRTDERQQEDQVSHLELPRRVARVPNGPQAPSSAP